MSGSLLPGTICASLIVRPLPWPTRGIWATTWADHESPCESWACSQTMLGKSSARMSRGHPAAVMLNSSPASSALPVSGSLGSVTRGHGVLVMSPPGLR